MWVEYKFERLPNFCFYCGNLSHEIKFCSDAKEMCVGFGGKYANFGDWTCTGLNMKVLDHVNWVSLVRKPMSAVGGCSQNPAGDYFKFSVEEEAVKKRRHRDRKKTGTTM